MVELGLIGYPLGHSYSARYFNDKFKREGIEGHYALYPIPDIESLPGLLEQRQELCGLNVTIPYKERVMRYLDDISDDAKEIGAVNVLSIRHDENGKRLLTGHNSDWRGFQESIATLLRPDITSALILGTGGGSKAVGYALSKLGLDLTFVSRNCKDTTGRRVISYEDLNDDTVSKNMLIVNTTPLGMFPDTESAPDIPYDKITGCHICYDLIYNPEETKFMRICRESGAVVMNGLEMLRLQAEYAWAIWCESCGR